MTDLELELRVEKGRAWLTANDNDPPGRFYLWWVMRLSPDGAWPQQPVEVVDRYRLWVRGFDAWLKLYCQLSGESVGELKRVLHENGRTPHMQQDLVEQEA